MLKENIITNMEYIVNECMGDSDAGCVATCPMHTDAKEYIRLIREDKGFESIKVIREKLFIPGTLGRICSHPCETKCKASEIKSPLAIASLKRYAADNFDREEDWDITTKEYNGKNVAIIGSGPSGLQAAIDLRKEGFKVTIFEKHPVRGGLMAVGVPEYKLPRNVLEKEISYLDKLGVEFNLNCEVGKDIEFDEIIDNFDSVIVAVGKHKGQLDRTLNNIDAKGIFSAVDYMTEVSLTRNVSEVGKRVLVVGGGDVAMDCARTSRRLNNVEEVYSVCKEKSFDSMPSSNHEIKGAVDEGIKFNHSKLIKDIVVDENNRVCKVILSPNVPKDTLVEEDEVIELEVDTIVFAIGQQVEGEFAKGILSQKPNSNFECDRSTLQSVNNEKIFIAGDASGDSTIVIKAMATGRRAAESVRRFLNNESLTEGRRLEDTATYRTKLKTEVDWSQISERRYSMGELDKNERINTFDEVCLGYTKEEALQEANRCRQCACKLCMKECIMLNDYTDCPKTLFKKYLDEGYEKVDKMIAFSCNDCHQCTIKCPKDLNLRENFVAMKEQYIKDNNEKQILDSLKQFDKSQELECSKEYSTTVLAEKEKKTKYLFVPGCTVPAYNPSVVEKTLAHLRETLDGEVGALLQCCGKVTKLVGEDKEFKRRNKMAIDAINETNADVIVTICPSCYKVYENTSDKKIISYWDLMREKIGIPQSQKDIGKDSDVVFNIHDSCVTRNVTSHHENVRWILDELGYKYEEMNNNRENTRCCGVGGMVCNSNPELYKRVYTRRANDCTRDNVITYCGSCRGTMEAAGKDSLHILNLLHEDCYYSDMAKKRGYTSEEEMWKNRLDTKKLLDNMK